MVDKKGCSVWLAPGLLGSASPLVAPSGERTLAADHHSSQSRPSGRPAGSIIPLLPVAVLRAVPRNSPYRREQKAFVVGAVDVLHVRRVQLMTCAVTAHGLLAKPAFFYEQRGPCRCHEVVRYAAHDKCTYSFAHVDSPSEEGRSRQPFNAAGLSAVPRRCSHAGPELYRNAPAVLLFSLLLRWPAYKACVTINQKTAAQNRFDTLNRIGIHSKEWRYSTSIEVVRGKNRLAATGSFLRKVFALSTSNHGTVSLVRHATPATTSICTSTSHLLADGPSGTEKATTHHHHLLPRQFRRYPLAEQHYHSS